MKALKNILFLALIVMIVMPVMAQKVKDKDFKTKLKLAKKEAKSYEDEGWYVAPGDLPLEKQLENTYVKQLEEDDYGYPKYIVSSGNSVAGTQSAAKLQATELAKLEIANQLSSQIAATIDNQVANNQINSEEAATLQKTVAASKSIIATRMGRVIGMVEMYRKNEKTKNIECAVRIGYSVEMAKQMALAVMKEQLQDEANIASDKLEKLLDF
ncbi:MAG: hypothetical protein OEY56_08175 [Cyclobacteriaceae bacterium]|nr:hypothetical protein [Cyclobacteriaceae bacterium]